MENKNVRKAISVKLRFEVFKRDNFTCQYCGRKSPDVILHVDHIDPVKNGGDNNIINLITSCADCNFGKKHYLLTDNTVLEKQKKEIKELTKKRKELEILVKEREKVRDFGSAELNEAVKHYNSKFIDNHISYVDTQTLKRIVKKFGLVAVLNTIDDVNYTYLYWQLKSAEEKSVLNLYNIIKEQVYDFNNKFFHMTIMPYTRKGHKAEKLINYANENPFTSMEDFSIKVKEFINSK